MTPLPPHAIAPPPPPVGGGGPGLFPRARVDTSTQTFRHELPRTREAPRLTRQQLVDWLGADLDRRELDDATLLASELATNAVVHGRGRIGLHAQIDQNRLLVEVMDEGNGFERIVREPDFDHVGGRGLYVVDAVASRWGIRQDSSHVWFELERRGSRS